jgi:hypothetical protein
MMFLPTEPDIVLTVWAVHVSGGDDLHVLSWQRRMILAAFGGEQLQYPSPLPRRYSGQWWHGPAESR